MIGPTKHPPTLQQTVAPSKLAELGPAQITQNIVWVAVNTPTNKEYSAILPAFSKKLWIQMFRLIQQNEYLGAF